MQPADEQRPKPRAPRFNPRGFFARQKRTPRDDDERHRMAPCAPRVAGAQRAFGFVDGVGGVLEIDPDIGRQAQLHRAREHFDGVCLRDDQLA